MQTLAVETLDRRRCRDGPAPTKHACGVAALLAADSRRAVGWLREATNAFPDTAAYWSDLAVGLQELARFTGDPQHSLDALVASDRALRVRPDFLPALFNRALALESLGLEIPAIHAYGLCMRKHPNTPWTQEAIARVWRLKRPRVDAWREALKSLPNATDDVLLQIVTEFPVEVRAHVEDELLAEWGAFELAKKPVQAEARLRVVRRIGRALHQARAESPVATAVEAIDQADAMDRADLARGHVLFGEAREAYREGRFAEARVKFARASDHFQGLSRMMWVEAGYLHNNCLQKPTRLFVPGYGGSEHEMARQTVDALATFEDVHGAPRPIDDAGRAMYRYMRMGHRPEAWRMRTTLFRRASRSANFRCELQVAVYDAARSEIFDGRWESAHALLNVVLDKHLRVVAPIVAEASLWRAISSERLGRRQEMADDLATARCVLDRVNHPAFTAMVQPNLLLAEGVEAKRSNPRQALMLLTRAIEKTPRHHDGMVARESLVERARTKRALGDAAGAIVDLEAALRTMRSGTWRDAYSPAVESIINELVDVFSARGDAGGVRPMLERAFDGMSHRPLPPRAPDKIVARYVVLPDHVLVFVNSRVVRVPVTAKALDRAVIELARCIEDGREQCERPASRLGTWLLDPLTELTRSSTLTIITNQPLARVPFGALRWRATNRRLIEDVTVVRLDNRISMGRLSNPRPAPRRVVAVGNPAFDRSRYPSLPRLPAAELQADDTVQAYAPGVLLTGTAATPKRVTDALREADIADFATHAVISPGDPSRSCLLLAPTEASSGLLYLHEIENLDLHDLRLVTLFGCHTGAPVEGEGDTSNLALAFLSAGARNVIASLWEVQDDIGRDVSFRLHRELKSGLEPAEALRRVQTDMLRSPDARLRRLKSWSGLEAHVRGEQVPFRKLLEVSRLPRNPSL